MTFLYPFFCNAAETNLKLTTESRNYFVPNQPNNTGEINHTLNSPQEIVFVSFCNIFVAGVVSQKGASFLHTLCAAMGKNAIYATFKFKKLYSFIITV